MATAELTKQLTPEQYLAWERSLPRFPRHEYYDGEIVTLAGAKRAHILITMNLGGEIHDQLRGRPEEVYPSEMRVAVDLRTTYVYPDIVAVRDEPRFIDNQFDTLLNPVLVIEILSPSTEANDRGRKSERYRRCATLEEYVLVAQDKMRVEHHARRGDEWVLTVLEGLDDVLRLDSIGCVIPLGEIYAKVTFPTP